MDRTGPLLPTSTFGGGGTAPPRGYHSPPRAWQGPPQHPPPRELQLPSCIATAPLPSPVPPRCTLGVVVLLNSQASPPIRAPQGEGLASPRCNAPGRRKTPRAAGAGLRRAGGGRRPCRRAAAAAGPRRAGRAEGRRAGGGQREARPPPQGPEPPTRPRCRPGTRSSSPSSWSS